MMNPVATLLMRLEGSAYLDHHLSDNAQARGSMYDLIEQISIPILLSRKLQ